MPPQHSAALHDACVMLIECLVDKILNIAWVLTASFDHVSVSEGCKHSLLLHPSYESWIDFTKLCSAFLLVCRILSVEAKE